MPYEPPAASKARCEAEMKRPVIQWTPITMDTVNNGHDKKGPGTFYNIEFPWNEAMLHEYGAEWLTKAFHACGSLDKDNKVKRIVTQDEFKITTGNNGGKFLFEVEYENPSPELDTKLFAKVPFPLEGATKTDRLSSSVNKQPMEFAEINTSRLMEGVMPFKIPKMYFGDISNETSNWILITECIKFAFDEQNYGKPGEPLGQLPAMQVEGPYDKCIDLANLRGASIDYYMVMMKKGAMLCGMHKAGTIGIDDEYLKKSFGSSVGVTMASFPMKPDGISGNPKNQMEAQINSGLKFFEQAKVVFPEFVTTDAFKQRFRTVLLTLNAYAMEIAYWKEGNPDFVALSHANMNVDNCYFWRDENGALDCGVLDWGGFNASSLGHKMWWWMYCQDYEALKANIDSLLQAFIDTYAEYGGPKLDFTVLKNQFLVTAMQQMMGLIAAVGQINRMCKPDQWKTIQDRYDPRIALNVDGKSSLRLYLHCMNSIMRIIQEWDGDKALYEGFVQDVYVKEWGKTAKTPAEIGLEEAPKALPAPKAAPAPTSGKLLPSTMEPLMMKEVDEKSKAGKTPGPKTKIVDLLEGSPLRSPVSYTKTFLSKAQAPSPEEPSLKTVQTSIKGAPMLLGSVGGMAYDDVFDLIPVAVIDKTQEVVEMPKPDPPKKHRFPRVTVA